MIKKLLFFVTTLLIVSCHTSKPAVQTKRTVAAKPSAPVVRTIKKPIVKTPIESPPEIKPVVTNSPKTEVLEATTRVKVTAEIVSAYIAQFKDIAKSNMTQYGIPSSIILAQGILESGAGTGPLSMAANNHFGIKCHKEWKGPSVKHDDDSAQECFRKYEKPNESYKDHALFLTSRPWYAGLFKLKKDDYRAWAKGLKAAGYATDPKYPIKLISIIERYKLNQYDAEVLGMNYTSVDASVMVADNSNSYNVIKGDTLYSISKKFNLTIEELKRKNNMTDNALSIGQNLRVE
ncbi:glucosaminidase domain-containing protein [Flavobacterium sp.]|uniref:glucosaminidase domain-containing protein n=1 Tax=Flavobacterium sp. TaxID=239 RepID=UPI002B4ACE0F|nr:glucosaminidase domain-containing protein [Flavobacterium sp.]HLF52301.1 glucosaminidase domain-containing protein [Flavobacterium sp.]